ncbi:MAG: response regulator [Flavobacteriales bacterium]|nr:response regulator [Flavobacteriales bacterium]
MKKILLIEDNLDMRENTAEMLELANYNVRTAENGKIGVEIAKEWIPDLIICDIMMPQLDGYGVLHMISKNPDTSTIPFIFLTAKAEASDVRKGMNMGADDYLTKPFSEVDLLDTIEVRFKKSEITRKAFERTEEGLETFFDEARGLSELQQLSAERRTKMYKKKETIFREGDYANYLYFITSGKVKCVKSDDYGKDLVTDIFGEGEFLGYMGLLEGDEYIETASALEDTVLSIIPRMEFLELIRKNRDVAATFIKMLANNVKDKEIRLLQLAYSPVRERVAHTLLNLHRQFGKGEQEESGIKFSREDLAAIVGTATESLIRQLSDFKEEGLIKVKGREIRVLDEQGLQDIVGM